MKPTQHGFSLVELMVGLTVGLVVSAGALTLVSRQITETQRLQLDLQLQQDLRNAADLITRDLRRASHWAGAAQGLAGGAANPHTAVQGGGSDVAFSYARSAGDDGPNPTGFRLKDGTVQMLVGGAGWQALTDAGTMTVTAFELALHTDALPLACARPCAAGDAQCPPQQQLRSASLRLAGQAVHDAKVQRSVATSVRLRNDVVSGHCPA